MKKLADRSSISLGNMLLLVVGALFLFCLPLGLRILSGNSFPPGDEPYFHARLATELLEKGLFMDDSAILGGRTVFLTPFHVVLGVSMTFLEWHEALLYIPLLFSVLSVALLVLVIRTQTARSSSKTSETAYLTYLFYVVSPVTLYLATHAVPASFSLFLLLLGIFLFQRKKESAGTIMLVINSLLGVLPALMSLVVYWFVHYNKNTKRSRRSRRSRIAVTLLAALALFAGIQQGLHVFSTVQSDFLQGINAVISDFGSYAGISIFTLLLGFVGLFVYWKLDSTHHKQSLFALFLLLLTFLFTDLLPYTNVVVSVLAANAARKILAVRWELESMKRLTLVLFICGIIFSGFSHALLELNEQPTPGFVQGLVTIRTTLPVNTTVLAHPAKGFWIEFFSKRNVLLDKSEEGMSEPEVARSSIATLFETSDLVRTEKLLAENNIRHIVVTPDYFNGLVWERREQGLHFLLENNEKFKRQFSNSQIEVWKYTPNT